MGENFWTEKKVLVTGGAGFIGGNLSRKLVNEGASVTTIVRYSSTFDNIEDIVSDIDMILGDVCDYDTVEHAVKDMNYIFHLAGQISHPKSVEDPLLDLDSNCRATLNLLEACKIKSPDAKILFSGSVRAAGTIVGNKANEEQREKPISIYDLHKLTAEKYMGLYHQLHGLNTVTLRFPNVFGEGQANTNPDSSVINHFAKKAVNDMRLEVYGDGGPLRDYCHVSDVVDACLRVVNSSDTWGQIYLVGSGEGRNFKEVVDSIDEAIKKRTNRNVEIENIPTPELIKKTVQGDFVVDNRKLKSTGWLPQMGFEEGIQRTVDFYLERKNG